MKYVTESNNIVKILFVTPYYYPRVGGVEKVARLLGWSLRKHFKIEILTRKHVPNLKSLERIENITVRRMEVKNLKEMWKAWLWCLSNINYFIKFDVIQLFDITSFYWLLPVRLLLPSKPFVLWFMGYETYPIKFYYKLLRKIAEKFVQFSIVGGEYLRKYYGTRSKLSLIAFAKKFPRVSWRKKPKFAAFIGRLEKDTSILEYFKMLAILKQKYNMEVNIDIIGDGSLINKLKSFTKANNLKINFLGVIQNADELLKQYKFVLATPPQYSVIVHALASKTIVLSICNNELKLLASREFIGEKPFIIIAKNSEEAARIFYELLNTKWNHLEKFTEEGRKFAKENYNVNRVSNIFLNIYQKLISKNLKI